MILKRRWVVGVAMTALLAVPAFGSGVSEPRPVYVFADPQSAAERLQMASGRLPIVKGATTEALLYLDWRRLNGLSVDQAAAEALAAPCCGTRPEGGRVWVEARRQVPGVPSRSWIDTERRGPNYTSTPNCFDDAFATAAATLTDRVGRFGATSPMVRAWVDGQDAVFKACSEPVAVLPALPAAAPAWLRADRAYQDAALALYNGQTAEAARRFAAIGADPSSPWRPLGPYLSARTLLHAALDTPDAGHFTIAHAAIDRLAAAPAGTYGQGELKHMREVLEFREHPDQLRARLDRALAARAPIPEIAVAFRDYMALSDRGPGRPEAADWIRTIQAKDRGSGLDHAVARWRAGGTSAWLLAALTLANPGDAASPALAAAAGRVAPTDPAWLTARYHRLRLLVPSADPAMIRAEGDAVLARQDLSRSDRNIFTAVRAQAAASLADFADHALRDPYCVDSPSCTEGGTSSDDLVGRLASGGFAGLAIDARTIIDGLPLAQRMALVNVPRFPREIRLDIALTSYVRAVQLQDDPAIDRLARRLADLLPQVREDWGRIARTRPGADKRFAETFVLTKIPGARADLAGYQRPTGTVRQFGGYWVDLGRRVPAGPAGKAGVLSVAGWRAAVPQDDPEEQRDTACLSKCGESVFAPHAPPFLMPLARQAAAERRAFLVADATAQATTPRALAVSLWNEALLYVASHPKDPRAPETLYRLIRVARWGGDHDHLGRRAFHLLHDRYPASTWTRQSPYYY